jgi:hypothetical protein
MSRSCFILALASLVVVGCGRHAPASDGFIHRFGSFSSPDGKRTVEVVRREKSLVDFKVLDATTGKQVVKDYVGSDAMRWFLWWETPDRLWGYGSDIGYFKCFDFTATGVNQTDIQNGTEVPQEVWDNLPSIMQERVKARAPKRKD